MGAWRLRAIVYGLLAAVSALVLWQSGALAGEPAPAHTLNGQTSQGHHLGLIVRGRELVAFTTGPLYSRCANRGWWRLRWYPSMTQANVSYRRDGSGFEVHEWPDRRFPGTARSDVNLWMRASFDAHGGVSGRIWYAGDPGGIRCLSGTIRFTAKP
jgi:hypothetical protein